MKQRVVVTGMGVVSPCGITLEEFETNLKAGRSGIRLIDRLAELKFTCQVGGVPPGVEARSRASFAEEDLLAMNSSMFYGCLAALDAWQSAGLERPEARENEVDWDAGALIGTGIGGMDTIAERVVPLVNQGKIRRLGSSCVEQIMGSSVAAKVGGLLALGNQVTSNSSACTTGTEAIFLGFDRVRRGLALRMLAGGSEGSSPYIWAAFDAMRVLARGYNDRPERASRPMSQSATGFVPASGAGVLLLESLEEANRRGVTPYAEILGGAVNCGGQRMGGSMTAPNPQGVQRCIRAALVDAGIEPSGIDAISGHLTATMADPLEIHNWAEALGRAANEMPLITATKSLLGHGLGAAGGMESVAVCLMLCGGYVHGSRNCEDLHPSLLPYGGRIAQETVHTPALRVMAKAGFGFGDVNGCLIFRKWEKQPPEEEIP